jgi:5'-3' exonuclease
MGVPGFSTWLRRRYPEAFSPVTQQQSFDHVCVICQIILYSHAHCHSRPLAFAVQNPAACRGRAAAYRPPPAA